MDSSCFHSLVNNERCPQDLSFSERYEQLSMTFLDLFHVLSKQES